MLENGWCLFFGPLMILTTFILKYECFLFFFKRVILPSLFSIIFLFFFFFLLQHVLHNVVATVGPRVRHMGPTANFYNKEDLVKQL